MAKDRKEIGNRYIREAVNLTAMLPPVTLTPAESSTSTHHRFCSRAAAVATTLATKDLILSLIMCPPLRQVLVSSDKVPKALPLVRFAANAQAIVCDSPFLAAFLRWKPRQYYGRGEFAFSLFWWPDIMPHMP